MTHDRSLPTSWTVTIVRDDADVWAVRKVVRAACDKAGASLATTEALVTATSEITRNIIIHASYGEVLVGVVDSPWGRSVVVRGCDQGPGIADTEVALRDGYSTTGSLGLGLPGARGLADEFELASEPGVGTTVTLWKHVTTERKA